MGSDLLVDALEQLGSRRFCLVPSQADRRATLENKPHGLIDRAIRDRAQHAAELRSGRAIVLHHRRDDYGPRAGDGDAEREPARAVELHNLSAVAREPPIDASEVGCSVSLDSNRVHGITKAKGRRDRLDTYG